MENTEQEARIEICANVAALIQVVIDAGLITPEGFEKLRLRARAQIEQKAEDAYRKALAENPGLELVAKLFGMHPTSDPSATP